MSTSPLSVLGQPTRSLEWLIGPDALLSSTALSTGQLGALGPIASLIEGGLDAPLTEGAVSDLTGSTTGIANQAVLDVHAALENLGHEIVPLNGPLHALTHLGETIGLGRIGEPGNLLTDLSAVPAAIADGGGLVSAAPALTDLGDVLGAADGLVASVAGTATTANLLGSDGLLAPVSNLANAAILDIHANIEGLGHDLPVLNEALHGLIFLGETIGLGRLGEGGTLLTDLAALPGDLLHGEGLAALSPILGDLGSVTGAATGLLGDVIRIPSALLGGTLTGTPLDGVLTPVTALLDGVTGGHTGAPLDGLLGGLTGGGGGLLAPVTSILGGITGDGGHLTGDLLGSTGTLQPVGDVANGLIDGIHATIETLGHDIPILNVPLHEVINTGTTIGLGALGEGNNLLTDTANLPGDILSGNGAVGLGQVVADVGHVADAAGGLVGSVPGVLDGVLSGNAGAGTPLDGVLGGLTGGGLLAPVTGVVDGVTGGITGGGAGLLSPVTAVLNGVTGDHSGTPLDGVLGGLAGGGLLAPVTGVVDGVTGGIAGGGGGLLSPVTAVLGGVTGDHSETPLDGVLGGLAGGGLLAPVTGVVDGVTGGIAGGGGGLLSPVTAVLGGVTGDHSGTPLDGVLGGLAGGGLLAPVVAGATGGGGGLLSPVTAVLDGPTGGHSGTPLDGVLGGLTGSGSGLLSGDGIAFPSTGGGGGDALVGHALDIVHTATSGSADADASHSAGLDLGILSVDLGGHADAHHADPTPHGATGGLHLLGL